ncbi:cytoskeleton-associated protein 2 [Varanus komodoensis]|uniref:cytoskeleton-associated protein 2 n=1 Tax=Varanus komodoensis TaxID=61221 RepID=UPI001CF78576|nr:cytoskeleton-associated protein 2 [Varanus komodoensis]XP_044300280.1 cytoskeleton-associated protein 2 [Varanus komodoensis]XP_044300281.1 cytoskeleton-associated protein 2 [Varanus komodoensis]
MEDKENANGSAWNHMDSPLGKNLASPKVLQSPNIVKQSTIIVNCSPLASTAAVVPEPAEAKNKSVLISQNVLLKKNTKEKQVKTAPPNSGKCLSERRVLGAYRGRVVSSKVNSFRKIPGNDGTRYSLAGSPKLLVRTAAARSSTDIKNARVPGTVSTSKSVDTTVLQTKPPVKVSVSHPKPIVNHEKQSINKISVNKGTSQKNPERNWKPPLKNDLPNASNSVYRTKKPLAPKTITGSLVGPVSATQGTMSASKSVDNRKSILANPAEVRRIQLSEWQRSKGIKKPPAPMYVDTQPETETPQQTVKEPIESFWAAIAEEDEQGLVSDKVNKTLEECLSLIEKGCPGDTIQSTLERLIVMAPDAKKFAKYWICQMRLEQFHSTEKVLGIFENAILAGAQPKDELRRALADAMRALKNLSTSNEECVKKEITLNHEKEVNSDEVRKENACKEVLPSENMGSSNDEASQKATEACLKSEQESIPDQKKHGNKDHKQKHTIKKEEQGCGNAKKDHILEINTPENDNAGSYLIKYNLSTTPYLESTKKKLQSEASDSALKDLKFLTPVRRSRRIHEKVSKLPDILKEQSPCVSSLEQLGELGEEGMGYIYRENSALRKNSVHQKEQCKE